MMTQERKLFSVLSNLLSVLIRIHMVAFRGNPDNPGYCSNLKMLNLIMSAKNLYPIKVSVTGSSD